MPAFKIHNILQDQSPLLKSFESPPIYYFIVGDKGLPSLLYSYIGRYYFLYLDSVTARQMITVRSDTTASAAKFKSIDVCECEITIITD